MGLEVGTIIAIVSAVVSVGTALYVANQDQDDNAGATITKQGTQNSRNKVYGKTMVSCTNVYSNVDDNDKSYRTDVFAVGGIGTLKFHNVWINDKKMFENDKSQVTTASSSVSGTYGDGVMRKPFQKSKKLEMQWRSGQFDQVAAKLAVDNSDGEWTTSHKGAGVPQIVIYADFTTNQEFVIHGDRYNIKVLATAEDVFDPRTGAVNGKSSNPALALRDYLTSSYYGLGIDANEYINDATVIHAANKCDEYGLQINAELDGSAPFSDNLRDIMACFGGSLAIVNGKIEFLFEDAEELDLYDFDDSNILEGSLKVSPAGSSNYYNAVSATFKSEKNNYVKDNYLIPADVTTDARILSDGYLKTKDIELPFMVDAYEVAGGEVTKGVKFIANRVYKKAQHQINVSFDIDLLEFPDLRIWSVVSVTNDIYGFDKTRFRVQSMKTSVTEDKLNIATVNLIEYNEDVYNNDITGSTVGGRLPIRNDDISPPTGLTFDLKRFATDGYGVLSWSAGNFTNSTTYDVQYRLSTADDSNPWKEKITAYTGTEYQVFGLKKADYDFRVRTRDTIRGLSDWVELNSTTVSTPYNLPTVTGLAIDTTAPDFVISWDDMSDVAIANGVDSSDPQAAGVNGTVADVFQYYEVLIFKDSQQQYAFTTTESRYVYTKELNDASPLGTSRNIDVVVRLVDKAGQKSTDASKSGTNVQIGAPSNLTVVNVNGNSLIEWNPKVERDFAGTQIHVSKTKNFTPSASTLLSTLGGESTYLYNYDPDDTSDRYLKVAHFDTFGKTGLNYSPELTLTYVGAAGSSYFYIKPLGGTAIKNGEGSITLEAHRVTSDNDEVLSSGAIELYVGETAVGYTKTFTPADINGAVVVEMRDNPNGTVLDSITLVDVQDGAAGADGKDGTDGAKGDKGDKGNTGDAGADGSDGTDAIYGSIDSTNGLTWVQAPETAEGVAGAWSPTATTTNVVATFYQGGSAIASKTITVNRQADGTLKRGTVAGDSSVTYTVAGDETAALAITFTHQGVSVSEGLAALKGAAHGSKGDKGDKGNTGAAGSKGNKHYYVNGTVWSDSVASNFVQVSQGDQLVEWDVVTIHNAAAGFSASKYWDGNSWEDVGEVIDGNLIVDGTVRADAIDVDELFAKDIAAKGSVEVGNTDTDSKVTLSSRGGSPITVSTGDEDLFYFDAANKLQLKAGLGVGTINDPSVFSQAIWDQIKPVLSEGATGGSFTADDLNSDGQLPMAPMAQTIVMTSVNKSTVTLASRLTDRATGSSMRWTLVVTMRQRASGGSWGSSTTVHSQTYYGSSGRDGMVAIGVNYAEEVDVSAVPQGGDLEFKFTYTYVSGAVGLPRVYSTSASQAVEGGGQAGYATSLSGYAASDFAKVAESNNFQGTTTIQTPVVGGSNKIRFANNDYIRYDDGANRFHFDVDGGSSNAGVQAATFYGALSGNASSASKWATARTITLSGDVTGSVSIDGSANKTLSVSVNNDSHSHSFANLINKASGSGSYYTDGAFVAGRGSGSIAMTINDGYGNSNLTFNHQSGVPDQNGNAARIEVNTDSTTGAAMYFELKSGVTKDTAVSLTPIMDLTESNVKFHKNIDASGRTVTATTFAGALSGNAATASKWATARTLTLSGDASGSVSLDGTANKTLTVTVNDNSHVHAWLTGVDTRATNQTPNSIQDKAVSMQFTNLDRPSGFGSWYSALSVKGWGDGYQVWQLLGGSNTTTDNELYFRRGRTTTWESTQRIFMDDYHPNADKWTTARTLTLAGDASGSVSIDGSANKTLTVTVNNNSHTHDFTNITGQYAASRNIDTYNHQRFWSTQHSTQTDLGTRVNSWFFYTNLGGNSSMGIQLGSTYGTGNQLYFRSGTNNNASENGANNWTNWRQVYHDGYHPSADNADRLGGIGAGSFIRSDADDNVGAHTEWQDSKEIRFGNSADGRLFHDGTNTHLRNYTGNLYIRSLAHGGEIYLQAENDSGSNQTAAAVIANTDVYFEARHNSSTKLVARSGGVDINGTASIRGGNVEFQGSTRQHITFKNNSGTAQGYIYKDPDVAGIMVTSTHLDVTGGLRQDGNIILNGSDTWLRTTGSTGWYSTTYQGGIYMTDTTWVKTYNAKKFQVANTSYDAIYTTGGFRGRSLTNNNGAELVLNAGESANVATGQTGEKVYVNAENGLEISASRDNWQAEGWAGRVSHYLDANGANFGGRIFTFGRAAAAEKEHDSRGFLIEKSSDSTGETACRWMFTEHNSTTASQYNYGLSFQYDGIGGSGTLPSGSARLGTNAMWAMRRHDNSLNGTNVMYGYRNSNDVRFTGKLYATSHGAGTSLSPVMTHGDFLPETPPAGLEDSITSSWISAGAINARHLQVNGGTNAANGSKRSFKIAPDDPRPLHFAKLNDDLTVKEDIFYVEEDGDAYFSGKLSKDTVDINSIQEEARKQINPHYLGTVSGGSQQKTNVTLTSGGNTTLATVTTIGGKVIVNFKLNASSGYFGDTNQNHTAPDWTVELRRNNSTGTVLFSKRYQGSAWNFSEQEFTGDDFWDGGSNLSIDETFVDNAAPSTEVYCVRVVRHSGTPTSIKLVNFKAESPSFAVNQLKVSGVMDVFWEKETGYMITTGKHFVNEDTQLTITFPYAYTDVQSATITANINATSTADTHNSFVSALSTTQIKITNGDEYSTGKNFWWQVTGRRSSSI